MNGVTASLFSGQNLRSSAKNMDREYMAGGLGGKALQEGGRVLGGLTGQQMAHCIGAGLLTCHPQGQGEHSPGLCHSLPLCGQDTGSSISHVAGHTVWLVPGREADGVPLWRHPAQKAAKEYT